METEFQERAKANRSNEHRAHDLPPDNRRDRNRRVPLSPNLPARHTADVLGAPR